MHFPSFSLVIYIMYSHALHAFFWTEILASVNGSFCVTRILVQELEETWAMDFGPEPRAGTATHAYGGCRVCCRKIREAEPGKSKSLGLAGWYLNTHSTPDMLPA